MIRVIGGGLAGCEAAWQAASRGVPVTLSEMRPVAPTRVHHTDYLAELVCSNSFRGAALENAVGLLKEEMRRLGSLVMQIADQVQVPAGGALAVDRTRFAEGVTRALERHPLVSIRREEVRLIPDPQPGAPVIVATGPLTSEALSTAIAEFVGTSHLYFYDAVSPIVLADTIDRKKAFSGSRYGRDTVSLPRDRSDAREQTAVNLVRGEGDYLNCPMDESEYQTFYEAILSAERAEVHDFDDTRFFEGCLPIEVMAHRGVDTLRFGPMKPVGLRDPATGRRPYAVVQLRQDDLAADHYSLVGFQTQLKWGEQRRVFQLIPGLENAEFVRYGMIHRNTYINAPRTLTSTGEAQRQPGLFFAGQISGVEGYVESSASGLLAGMAAVAWCRGEAFAPPPRTTALGAMSHYVSHANPLGYEPTNVAFGLFPSLEDPPRQRRARRLAMADRALKDLDAWRARVALRETEQPNATAARVVS